jgi:hypothetical protein
MRSRVGCANDLGDNVSNSVSSTDLEKERWLRALTMVKDAGG